MAVALFVRKEYRAEFATATGWRPERELFQRLEQLLERVFDVDSWSTLFAPPV